MVGPGRLELPTRGLGNRCSIHLSYGPSRHRAAADSITDPRPIRALMSVRRPFLHPDVVDPEDAISPDGAGLSKRKEVVLLAGDVLRERVGGLRGVFEVEEHPELDRLPDPLDGQPECVQETVLHGLSSTSYPLTVFARAEENRFLGTALGLAAVAFVLYMGAASVRDFWSPDEPDFAEAVREMKERGSFLLPYQNGVPYSEKPILFYWAIAATLPLGGGDVDPVAARIPSALGAAGLVFGAAAVAGRRGGRR